MIVFFHLREPTNMHVLRFNEDSNETVLAGMLAMNDGMWSFAMFNEEGTEPIVIPFPNTDLLSCMHLVEATVCPSN